MTTQLSTSTDASSLIKTTTPPCLSQPSSLGNTAISVRCRGCNYAREFAPPASGTESLENKIDFERVLSRKCSICEELCDGKKGEGDEEENSNATKGPKRGDTRRVDMGRETERDEGRWELGFVHRAPYRVCWACEVETGLWGPVMRECWERCYGCGRRFDASCDVVWKETVGEAVKIFGSLSLE